MPLDFPGSPSDEQKYDQYKFRTSSTSWQADQDKTGFQARIAAIEYIAPAGTMHVYAGSTAPTGFLLCQGQTVNRNSYPNLFAAISTNYGAGDGSTTFGIPDMQSRVAVGKNTSGTFATLNNKNALTTETHTLSVTEMASHTHIQNSHTHIQDSHNHTQNPHSHTTNTGEGYGNPRAVDYGGGDGWKARYSGTNLVINNTTATNIATTATNNAATATNQDAGGLAGVTQAHNNLQPYIVLNYIIKT